MTDEVSTSAPATQTTNMDSASGLQAELLQQLKEQTASNAALRAQQEASAQQLDDLKSKVESYQSVGKRRREEAINGAVKDWVAQMVETHSKELGPYESKLTELLGAMPSHDEADSMVGLLECAAAASADSTSKLNAAYQKLKESQESNKRLKMQITDAAKPAFSKPTERFTPAPPPSAAPPAPDAFSQLFSRSSSQTAPRRGGGMSALNPDLYSAIKNQASRAPIGGSAMNPDIDLSIFSSKTRKSFRSN